MKQQARRVEFHEKDDEPRHRCHKCGKTDLTHPMLDFRYCSKCAGEECYCSEHIASHEHTTVAAKKN
jgi:ribosomal protein L37AE/L43A